MRKIETQMLEAVRDMRTWVSVNTQTVVGEGGVLSVLLHGHTIAWVHKDGTVKPCQSVILKWPTRTTFSRLRALGVNICTRKGSIYLNGKHLTIANAE